MTFCVLLLSYFAYSFQDYNLINNNLLMQIQRQNMELKGFFESIGELCFIFHLLLEFFAEANKHDRCRWSWECKNDVV
jgi:hypothetical protein